MWVGPLGVPECTMFWHGACFVDDRVALHNPTRHVTNKQIIRNNVMQHLGIVHLG